MLVAVGIVAGVWLLARLWTVLVMVFLSLVMVGTIGPVVATLERRGWRRGAAIVAVVTGLLATLALIVFVTIPPLVGQLVRIADNAPAAQRRVAAQLAASRATAPVANLVRGLNTPVLVAKAERLALEAAPKAVEGLGYALTVLFLALYLVADRERTLGTLYAIVPRKYHLRTARVLLNLGTIVGGYVRGQALTSAAIGVFTFVLLELCRVPNALALAVFAGLTDVLPFVGGLLAVTPCVLAALTRGPLVAVFVLVALVVYQELESRVLIPRVYGRVLRLSPALVIVALLAGWTLLGMLGALLALPVAAGLRMVVHELRVALPGEDVDEHELRERDEAAEAAYAERAAGTPAEEAAQIAVAMAVEIRSADSPDDPAAAADVPVTGGREPGDAES
jgi:predicted PurR-regulated permease PerM